VALREDLPPITEAVTTPSQTDPVAPVWPAAPAQLPVPGYDLEAELGQGGMGRVYRARRARDGQTVAVKIIIPHAAPRPRTIARFQREMRILGRLDHPNIVRLLESGEKDGHLYFVMEHVAGCDAGSAVQRSGPLAPDRVVRLGCQLLDALAYAHGEGVIHRDIKPANLLLAQQEGKEVLKLADFGLARAYRASAMSGLTLTGEMAGTPAFMPPEQVRDLRSVRPPADQYAVAATLYYLLTGAGVYEPEHGRIDLLMRIVDTDPIPLRHPYNGSPLPGRLLEVIRRGLARQPNDRYPDVPAMRSALASAL
jgi:serine/threonine-protein kinase